MLLYTLPGIPSVYYGSEFGIEGGKEYGSDWNLRPDLNLADYDENGDIPKLHKALGKIKARFPEVTWGDYKELNLTTRQYAYARILDGKAVITALNNDDNPAHMEISLPVYANRTRRKRIKRQPLRKRRSFFLLQKKILRMRRKYSGMHPVRSVTVPKS